MSDSKMTKYLGRYIPISKWVHGTDGEGMAILKSMVDRMKASDIRAGIAFDRGNCCVYREVLEVDIQGKGDGYPEWLRSIVMHSVKTIEEVRYTRAYQPRKTVDARQV